MYKAKWTVKHTALCGRNECAKLHILNFEYLVCKDRE